MLNPGIQNTKVLTSTEIKKGKSLLEGAGNYTNPAMFSQFDYNSKWHNLLTETFPTIWQFLFLQIVKTKLKNYIREDREGKILLFTIVILNTFLTH